MVEALKKGKQVPGITGEYKPQPYQWSSIPTVVAARTMEQIGDRDEVVKIWYDALHRVTTPEPNLDHIADATRAAAQALFGAQSKQATALDQQWKAVRQGESPPPAPPSEGGLMGKLKSIFG
jgi:hypothetical protein